MSISNRGPSSSVAPQNNLSYLNSNEQATVLRVTAQRDPTINDRRYKIGTVWINELTNDVFILTSVVINQANWQPTSLSSGSYPVSPYVVGPVGQAGYQTIQSALDAANADGGGAVWVLPQGSPYTEDLTLYPSTQVLGAVGLGEDGFCEIVGTHTPPTTGTFVFASINLRSTTHIFDSTAAGTAHLIFKSCEVINNGYAFNLPNWAPGGILESFDINNTTATASGYVNNTGGATCAFFAAGLGQTATFPMIISGPCFMNAVNIFCPIQLQGNANFTMGNSWNESTFTFSGAATGNLFNWRISSGASAAITHNSTGDINLANLTVDSTAAPAIDGTGAGTLTIGSINFLNNNAIAGTLTIGNAVVKSGYINSLSDVVLSSSGGHIEIEGGAVTDFIGSATLVGGTVTVANTNITATDRILVVRSTTGGTEGHLSYTITPSTSFTINSSSGTDTSTVVYVIIRQI